MNPTGPRTEAGKRLLTEVEQYPTLRRYITAEWVAKQERRKEAGRALVLKFAETPWLVGVLGAHEEWLAAVEAVDPARAPEYWARLEAKRRGTHLPAASEVALLWHLRSAGCKIRFWDQRQGRGPEWVAEWGGITLAVEAKRFTPRKEFDGAGGSGAPWSGFLGTPQMLLDQVKDILDRMWGKAKVQLRAAKGVTGTCLCADLAEHVPYNLLLAPPLDSLLKDDVEAWTDRHGDLHMVILYAVSLDTPGPLRPPLVVFCSGWREEVAGA